MNREERNRQMKPLMVKLRWINALAFIGGWTVFFFAHATPVRIAGLCLPFVSVFLTQRWAGRFFQRFSPVETDEENTD